MSSAVPSSPAPGTSWRKSPAVRVGLSISIATGLYAISFGALSVAAGLTFWQTMILSLFMFSGGSQFAFIGVIGGGGTGVAAMSAATLLGIRNGVYGMQMNALVRPRGWRKVVAAQVTIDESAATASGQLENSEQRRGFWTAGLGVFTLWNIFTAIGALAGDAMGDPQQWGLDGAAVAAFLGLLWPRLKAKQPAGIAVVCALVTVLTIPFLPSGVPILAAAAVAGAIGWFKHDAVPAGMAPDIEPYEEPYSEHDLDHYAKDRTASEKHDGGSDR